MLPLDKSSLKSFAASGQDGCEAIGSQVHVACERQTATVDHLIKPYLVKLIQTILHEMIRVCGTCFLFKSKSGGKLCVGGNNVEGCGARGSE